MSDVGGNGHDTDESRLLLIERDLTNLAAGDRGIMERIDRIAEQAEVRHADVLRVLGELAEMVTKALAPRPRSALAVKRRAGK